MAIYSKEEQLELIKITWGNIKKIDNQYEEVCLEAVKQQALAIQYINMKTEEICLEAVRQYGWTLQYIENQTPKICLEAVRQYGRALKYVKEQTAEICLEAVKQDGMAIKYVKEQIEEICLEAVKREGETIKKVRNKTPKLCFLAFLNKYTLLEYKYIQKCVDEFIKSSIENKVFCSKNYSYLDKDYYFFNINSLNHLKDYLLKQKNNKYILDDDNDINLLKEIALSNNELIIIDTGNIQDIHRILANKIIKEDDLKNESF